MTTIGQNSPATADPSVFCPRGEWQDAGVGEDRHERAERGRGDGDGDQPTVGADAGGLEGEAPGRAERDRDSPADRATGEEPARDAAVDHLDAREEEEKDDPEVGEELDVLIHLRDVEHLGADEDAEEDLDDDGGKHARALRRETIVASAAAQATSVREPRSG